MDLPHLASILRESGDQILNAISKLSLSTTLLKNLNESFSLIIDEREALNSTFQVIGTSSSKIELLLDLQFLHDFIQRTVSLKLAPIVHDDQTEQVDIRKFKNLKLLEIRRIPVKQILGLQHLRTQLQYLVCVHCIDNLKELIISCGGDKSDKYVWSELKEVIFSNNNLSSLDNSLEYVPWLQSLDLSHNKLVNVQAIDCLTNLKHLNLSYNQLEAVPLLNKELSRKLQVLVLKNNYIEDVTGLALLNNLVTLDLSFNCLVDHYSLTTLPILTALQWLSLEGNPLSYHPKHRPYTTSRLHPNTASVKFMLDRKVLTKSEKLLIGTRFSTVSRSLITPGNIAQPEREHHSSISSTASVNTHSSEITAIQVSGSLTRSQTSRKGLKARNVEIAERNEIGEIVSEEMMNSVASVESLEMSSEHLEMKKQIEILRNRYGVNWLQSDGASLVQDVLGIPKTTIPLSSSPYEADFKIHAADVVTQSNGFTNDALPVKDNDKTDVISNLSTNNTFVTASESSLFEENENNASSDSDLNTSDEEPTEERGEEQLYIAQIKHKETDLEEVFIMITNLYIKEKDLLNGRMKFKWHVEMLMKCEMISDDPPTIRVEYDTVRRSLKYRVYILNPKEAQRLFQDMNDIINKQTKNITSNVTVFNCMKCSYQFKVDTMSIRRTDSKREIPECPSCNSKIVCEVEESTPVNTVENMARPYSRSDSPSECSIASESESGPLADICVTAEVHRVSKSNSTNCSAVSVQESSSSQMSVDDNLQSDNTLKRYESDIEVISNPSQSSIEVLDDHSRPTRKRSSEERRVFPMPTIPDIATVVTFNPPVALTESSSSSSFTESICTAYDTHKESASRPESDLETHVIQEEEEEKANLTESLPLTENNKGGLISSIIGDLFRGAKEGIISSAQPVIPENNTSEITFTFSEDFSKIDHRVHLHLYQHIFEDEREDFIWLLNCSLLIYNSSEAIPACLVLSTQKIYTLHIKEHSSSEDVVGWLIKKGSYTIDRLQTIYSLPFKQGVGIEIRTADNSAIYHLCILQDLQHTTNFITYLASNPLPDTCDLINDCSSTSVYQRPVMNLQQALLSSSENTLASSRSSNISLLSLFSKCTVITDKTKDLPMGIILITSSHLILIEDITWLIPDSKKVPVFTNSQPICNLLELEFEENLIEFHFLDEVAGFEEVWCMECATEDSMNIIISAIKSPWEEIFSVPLQVNHKVHRV